MSGISSLFQNAHNLIAEVGKRGLALTLPPHRPEAGVGDEVANLQAGYVV